MKLNNKKLMTTLLLTSILIETIPYNVLSSQAILEINNENIISQKDINSKKNRVNTSIENIKTLSEGANEDAYKHISQNGYGVTSYSYEKHNSGNVTYKNNEYNSIIKDVNNEGYVAGGFLKTGASENISYLNKYSSGMELIKETSISKFKIVDILKNESDKYIVLGNKNLNVYDYRFDTIISYDSDLNKLSEFSVSDIGVTKANSAIYHNGYYYIVGTFSSSNVNGLVSKGGADIVLLKLDDNLNLIDKLSMGSVGSDEPYMICTNENNGLRILASNGTNLVAYDINESLSVTEKISSLSLSNVAYSKKLKNEYCFITNNNSIYIIDETLNTSNLYTLNINFGIKNIIKKNDNYYLVGRDNVSDSNYSILKTDNKFNVLKSHTLKKGLNFATDTEYFNILEDNDNIVAVGKFANIYMHGVPSGINNTEKAVITVYDENLVIKGDSPKLLGYKSGDGSKGNPYIISNTEEFNLFRKQCDLKITGDAHFKLNNDIDLTNFDTDEDESNGNWTPISHFAGTFDGNGHTISNVVVNTPDSYDVGLFSTVELGTIKNLKIKNINLSGYANVGAVVAYLDAGTDIANITIENATITAMGSGSVGGIVGGLYTELNDTSDKVSVIKNCSFDGIVSGNNQVGGLIGYSYDADIINCKASGEVMYIVANGSWKSDIGGLIGYYDCTEIDVIAGIKNSTFNGSVKAKEADYVGGLVGNLCSKSIDECKMSGTIEGNNYIGGAVGEAYLYNGQSIQKTSVNADITGKSYVGGFIGRISSYDSWNVQNNYTISTINAGTNGSGFIAELRDSTSNDLKLIQNNYTASTINSSNSYNSFIKYSTSINLIDMKNNYYDIDLDNKVLNTQLNGKVASLTTAQMQGKEALNNMNFDFENVWNLNEDYYPTLNPSNTAPTIIPNDKVVNSTITINQYDQFNPLDYVIVEDFENDEVTTIIKEDIDTSKYGEFSITYVATDSKGLFSELTLNLKTNPLMIKVNEAPVIVAEDIILTVGDEFNPLKVITAFDKEDGTITDNVRVIESTVDINTPGIYKVTYEVTDKDGAKATKTITVTVKEKVVSNDSNSDNNQNNSNTNDKDTNDKDADDDKNTNSTQKPQTSDIGFIGLSGILMSTVGLYSINRKKNK